MSPNLRATAAVFAERGNVDGLEGLKIFGRHPGLCDAPESEKRWKREVSEILLPPQCDPIEIPL